MKKFISRFIRCLSDVITLSPRVSHTRSLLRKSVEELGNWNDRDAIRGDFMAVGNDLRMAIKRYRNG